MLANTAWLALAAFPAHADESGLTRNLFGSPGLVDMPDARMGPDGELSASASFFNNTQRYAFGFQVTPWLETSFRYSGLTHFDPTFPVYYDRSFEMKMRLWDESDIFPAIALGINDVVGTGIYAGEYLVATKQFGDITATAGIGWGRLGTANTISNPFGIISGSFKKPRGYEIPGSTNFNTLFHGPTAGLFGGASWRTPIDGLSFVVEYSSDAYDSERQSGNLNPKTQFNFGLSYKPATNMTLGLDWLYGTTLAGTISFQLDPATDPYPNRIGPEPPPLHIRTAAERQRAISALGGRPAAGVPRKPPAGAMLDALWQGDVSDVSIRGRTLVLTIGKSDPALACRAAAAALVNSDADLDTILVDRPRAAPMRCTAGNPQTRPSAPVFAVLAMPSAVLAPSTLLTIDASAPAQPSDSEAIGKIRRDAAGQQLVIQAVSLGSGEALVYYTNLRYSREADALDRLVRVMMADAPSRIEKFRFIAVLNSVPQQEFDILRSPTERSLEQTGAYDMLANGNSMQPAPLYNPVLAAAERESYPHFSFSLFPQFRQELFDPSNPFAVQFLGGAEGAAELLPGLALVGEVEVNIWDNFNTGRPADSALPHVRTDFLTYFTKGKDGIGDLEADYRFRLAPDVFAIVRAGYLESMFAGAGGEILWRPEGQRWSLGADLYDVKQRNFDRLFGLQSYHVLTGHLSAYYESPWYQLNFAFHAGQYLAGDRGLTVEVTRRFDTGVEIGAFFTKTNVSATQFGEGSFDKGIIIRIPLDWVAPIQSQGQFSTILRPVQRDGGQRLYGDTLLYDETRRASEGEILEHRTGF